MQEGQRTQRASVWRGVSLLAVGALVAGVFAIGPATAAKPFSKKKALKLFYSKQQVDQTFLGETTVVTAEDSLTRGASETKVVPCPAGYQAVGGTSAVNAPDPAVNNVNVYASGPTVNEALPGGTPTGSSAFADGWFVFVTNPEAGTEAYRVSVVCAKPAA